MQPPIFFAPPESIADNLIDLPAEEARHAVAVLRLKQGTLVIVIDGLGTAYRGEIVQLRPRLAEVQVKIHDTVRGFGEPAVRLTLAAGMSTASKFDTIVEKGTEVGVTRFVPLLTDKSKIRVDDEKKARNKTRRLERVAMAATKQCRRSYRPDIADARGLSQFLKESTDDTVKLCFHPDQSAIALEKIAIEELPKRVTVLIGPESGFSPEEIAMVKDAGFQLVHIGRRILRTETAGPLAAALVLYRLGELR
jgi:16S rRNA (uracil1498-N3)-methyltransferase